MPGLRLQYFSMHVFSLGKKYSWHDLGLSFSLFTGYVITEQVYFCNNKLVLLICALDLTASGSALKLTKSRFGMSLFLVISLFYWVIHF